jgi:hypothetical protein
MNYCKKPCNDCPFRKDSLPGWLADYSIQELHSIVMNEMPFPCHMTHDENLGWDEAGSEEFPLCAGALGYMRKSGKLPRRNDLAVLVKQIGIKDLDNILSVPDFFKHHNKGQLEKFILERANSK